MWVCENRTSTPYFAAGGCRHWRDDVADGFTAAGFGRKRDRVYTYTISQDEEWMVTQDAYLVSRVLMREHAMTSPRDLFVKENRLYLADTGASRVLIYQLDTGDCREIGGETLSSPVGLSWIRTTSFMWPITALAPL